MILQQRNRHRFMWMGMAVVFLLAIYTVLENQELERPGPGMAPEAVQAKIILEGGQQYLAIEVQAPLDNPAAELYQIGKNEKALWLGSLRTQGEYRFALAEYTKEPVTLRLMDGVRKQVVKEWEVQL